MGTSKKQKKRDGLRYREFVLSPYGVIKIKSLGYIRMASKARAPVVPIHISGRNSSLFYLSSLLYRPLSTLLLVREMFQQRSQKLKIRIGARIPYAIAKRHYFDNSQLCFFAAYQGIGCNHF